MTTRRTSIQLWRGLSWQRWALRGVLAVVLLGLAALTAAHFWANRKMAAVLAEIEAQGISLEPSNYIPTLGRDEANASHILGAVCHLMASVPLDPEDVRWRDTPLQEAIQDPTLVEQARVQLERPTYRLVFATLDLHATTRRARAVSGEAHTQALTNSRYTNERGILVLNLRPLLRARALTEMAAGNSDAAYAATTSLLRLANWLHTELPSVLSWLIGNAMATSGLQTVEELLQISPPSPQARALIRAELRLLDQRGPSLGLEAELAMTRHQMLRGILWSAPDPAPSLKKALSGVWESWTVTAYHAHYLEAYSDLIRWAKMPAHQRPSLAPLLNDKSPFMIPVKFLVPNLRDSLDKTDAVRTRYHLAFLALAWQDYRDAHGFHPKAPEDLVPDFLDVVPEDEISGTPLLWRRHEDGWLVYSVGVNQKDEEGVDRKTLREGEEDDIFWRLPQ